MNLKLISFDSGPKKTIILYKPRKKITKENFTCIDSETKHTLEAKNSQTPLINKNQKITVNTSKPRHSLCSGDSKSGNRSTLQKQIRTTELNPNKEDN